MIQGSPLPDLPEVVIRIGFAGSRELSSGRAAVAQSLRRVFDAVALQLAATAVPVGNSPAHAMSRFYSHQPARLRLVTGLAEGADALAAETLSASGTPTVKTELAAVLPFGVDDYRASRPQHYQSHFDDLLGQCSYVMVLDGHHAKGTATDDRLRARAYRAVSQVLLRQVDVLVAVSDFTRESKAGGTQESIEAALAFDLPVVFVHSETGAIHLMEPGTDSVTTLATHGSFVDHSPTQELAQLRAWVQNIVAPPDTGEFATKHLHDDKLLEEFFRGQSAPPRHANRARKVSFRERIWISFENFFRAPLESRAAESSLDLVGGLRRRATELNHHYAGLYRGAFVVNYTLAVAAVGLAAISLMVLGKSHMDQLKVVAAVIDAAPATASHASSHVGLLVTLGLLKLLLVAIIYYNTQHANKENWNDKAIDYRYLAERLRGVMYLACAGSLQPPSASRPRYASRVVRQSAVDWLFNAVIRQLSPRLLAPDGSKFVTLNATSTLELVKSHWIDQQISYHRRNASTMSGIQRFTERWSKRLNIAVIIAVSVDLAVLMVEGFGLLPEGLSQFVRAKAPWLVFLAALLPAAVASLNGIRFQSECGRLADRSAVVARFLERRAAEAERLQKRIALAATHASGRAVAHVPEVLRLTEGCARDLVEEVTEWSVLYAKDIAEP